jgi:phosphoribosylanthranilate isomerase
MNKALIKICGITRKQDLDVATAAGADAVGFVVGISSSPRNIPLEKASKLIRQVPSSVKSVIVTRITGIEEIVATCKTLNPDAVQFHGERRVEVDTFREQLPNMTMIRAIKANPSKVVENALKAAKVFDAVLLDSVAHGKLGGTGIVHDWKLSRIVKQAIHPKPLILAGGLKPENVADAVRIVEPYGVDVSTGVELKPGIKDHKRIVAFIKNVKDVRYETI